MCGLLALIEPGRNFSARLLEDMAKDIQHRGPDSGGFLREEGVAFAFRRLAILDPTSASDQPMTDASGKYTIVYNGEIYNYQELRTSLSQAGVKLRSSGDTEAILEGYALWGEQVLDRLEGMFAFVLLDRARHLVFAARDPFGIKPLYCLQKGNLVALASEMRPFAHVDSPQPDTTALAEFLTFNWAAGHLSNFQNIDRIPGGTALRISLLDGRVERRRYCDPLETLQPDAGVSAIEAEQRARDAVSSSVKAHLVSDVGYTLQLSGGVDSSLIAALASRDGGAELQSFGINLGEYIHDEAPYRREVSERYGLKHHEISMSGKDFADALPRALTHIEGPSTHLGCVLLMKLCDHIRDVSKVVLTGEGGDEMFGGYLRYGQWRKLFWQERISRLMPRELWPKMWPLHGIRRFAGRDAAVFSAVYDNMEPVHRLFPSLIPVNGIRNTASTRFRDFRDRMTAVDQSAYLESLLIRQDKIAMAASVEARVPFVHMPLARVVNRLPRDHRVPGGITKPILKKISEPYLSRDLLYRRKVGLFLPLQEWLSDDKGLGRYLNDLTSPDCRLAGYAEPGHLKAAVDNFRQGRGLTARMMVKLINVETWLRNLPTGTA